MGTMVTQYKNSMMMETITHRAMSGSVAEKREYISILVSLILLWSAQKVTCSNRVTGVELFHDTRHRKATINVIIIMQ